MSATTTLPESPNTSATAPPDERFWRRYSPHGEAPLSLAGSFTLHLLLGGGLILFGVYIASLFFSPTARLPIDAVSIGSGTPKGIAPGNGNGPGGVANNAEPPLEDLKGPDAKPTDPDAPPAAVPLTQPQVANLKQIFNDDDMRKIQESPRSGAIEELKRLAGRVGNVGEPGGKGGRGPGDGTGGKRKLNDREKRMLRWHMRFTANSGVEYLAQLRDLKAILAFPVKDGDAPEYKVVRDLNRGGKLVAEDVSKIQRIFWIDDNVKSVKDVLDALAVTLPKTPPRFVAFMPEELEAQLFQQERTYVEKVLKRKFEEDKISETQFMVIRGSGGFKAELVNVRMAE